MTFNHSNDTIDRIKMVKAMEFICRQINDEDVFEYWLENGVADGDIAYGDFVVNYDDEYDPATDYISNAEFGLLMDCFLKVMKAAEKYGGLYCGGQQSLK